MPQTQCQHSTRYGSVPQLRAAAQRCKQACAALLGQSRLVTVGGRRKYDHGQCEGTWQLQPVCKQAGEALLAAASQGVAFLRADSTCWAVSARRCMHWLHRLSGSGDPAVIERRQDIPHHDAASRALRQASEMNRLMRQTQRGRLLLLGVGSVGQMLLGMRRCESVVAGNTLVCTQRCVHPSRSSFCQLCHGCWGAGSTSWCPLPRRTSLSERVPLLPLPSKAVTHLPCPCLEPACDWCFR